MHDDCLISDVIHSMHEIGYSPTHYHNGNHLPFNGSIGFSSYVSNAKDLFFNSWEEAAEWLKSIDMYKHKA